MKIRAAVVWEKSSPVAVEELEMEEPRADEVRVRVVGVGVCHTDFSVCDQLYPVPLPAVLGHEASGVVEQVGRHVAKVEPGDHVVLTYLPCGTCRNCVQGKPAYCLYTFPYNFGGARLDQSTALRKGSDAIHSHFFGPVVVRHTCSRVRAKSSEGAQRRPAGTARPARVRYPDRCGCRAELAPSGRGEQHCGVRNRVRRDERCHGR